ncbi:hypothetical protein [Amycolatopsis azurea]|uniref:hypothetical protein n=1 Tax=Amycolatopsis azurea TaxID=36819 RepID=UPI001301FC3E|nr:hypothetical protein [Amycolatopsis azurea]
MASYTDSKDLLFNGTLGVLTGSALVALLSLKGTLKKIAKDGTAPADIRGHVNTGVWIRAPFALLAAGLTAMPDGRAAHIVVGVYWGTVTAGFVESHTVLGGDACRRPRLRPHLPRRSTRYLDRSARA